MKTDNLRRNKHRRLDELVPTIAELESEPPNASTIAKLRSKYGSETAARLMTAASLQAKARTKLGPGVWWVTDRSLQQATPWQVARQKAGWFGENSVFDLCCGIGGDAIQLAKRGPTVAVDADRNLIPMVQANLAAASDGVARAAVICADVRNISINSDVSLHVDPSRRDPSRRDPSRRDPSRRDLSRRDLDRTQSNGRTTRPEHYQPSWSEIEHPIRSARAAVVKLAPAASMRDEDCRGFHRCWISLRGSVREQSLLCGEAIRCAAERLITGTGKPLSILPDTRSAVAIRADGSARCYAAEVFADRRVDSVDKPASLLIDPNEAIRAAGLTESFAADHDLVTLGGPSGFLTSDRLSSDTDMAIIGRVVWSGACDDRNLRRQLRKRNMFPESVKVRGTDHRPAQLTKRLRECGDQAVTLWIGRRGNRCYAALTLPVDDHEETAFA